jgi:uronate dehydrogenase
MKKIVLTGAAGRLGSYLREPLSNLAEELVSSDIVDGIGSPYANETYIKADLCNFDEILALLKGAEMVVHFGAYGDEGAFETILGPNIVGAYNIWESAYQNGLRRVVYASSIHAVGMHSNKAFIGTDAPHRPDTFYGLAKCFSEDLASLYWDKRGIEGVCLRILSCAQVTSVRALGTWLSYDDMIHLVERSISAPATGFAAVYGVSNNDRVTVDNSLASFLGYRPKDNAEQFAKQILAEAGPLDSTTPEHTCLGGPFAAVELGNSGKANMKIIDDTIET